MLPVLRACCQSRGGRWLAESCSGKEGKPLWRRFFRIPFWKAMELIAFSNSAVSKKLSAGLEIKKLVFKKWVDEYSGALSNNGIGMIKRARLKSCWIFRYRCCSRQKMISSSIVMVVHGHI